MVNARSLSRISFILLLFAFVSGCKEATSTTNDIVLPASAGTTSIASVQSSVTADGLQAATIHIDLRDIIEMPIVGVTPTFSATDTGGTNSYGACTATDLNGRSVCTLSSTKAERKTLRLLTPVSFYSGFVDFVAGSAVTAQSDIQGSGPVSTDGATSSTITITLKDQYGNPVVGGAAPTFDATGSNNTKGTCSSPSAAGVSTCTLSSTTAEVKTLSIVSPVADTGGIVEFTVGAPSATTSTITGTGPVVANGVATSTITITLRDANSNPVAGVTPEFAATDDVVVPKNSYGACSATDSSGVSTCTLASTKAEIKTLSITEPISKASGGGTVVFNGMNLIVPIEMSDIGMHSGASEVVFNRTQTKIDTTFYDGTVSYKFEIVSLNTSGSSKNVYLVDSNGNTLATVAVPHMPPSPPPTPTYFSVYAPLSGIDVYRVKLQGTSAAGQLKVLTARIIVEQSGATRTRIYVPLYGLDPGAATSNDLTNTPITSTIYSQSSPNRSYSIWRFDLSRFSQLVAANPFTFEVVMSSTAAGVASYASLFKAGTSNQIYDSEITTSLLAPSLVSRSFGWGVTSGEINDGDILEVKQKADTGTSCRLHKAGLWVALDNLSKVESYYRISRASIASSSEVWMDSRAFINLNGLSNPQVFAELAGAVTPTGSTIELLDAAANPDGVAGTLIAGSILGIPGSKGMSRSAALSLGAGYAGYIVPRFNYVTSTTTNVSHVLVPIQFSLNP